MDPKPYTSLPFISQLQLFNPRRIYTMPAAYEPEDLNFLSQKWRESIVPSGILRLMQSRAHGLLNQEAQLCQSTR
jgi:hypothetical protein